MLTVLRVVRQFLISILLLDHYFQQVLDLTILLGLRTLLRLDLCSLLEMLLGPAMRQPLGLVVEVVLMVVLELQVPMVVLELQAPMVVLELQVPMVVLRLLTIHLRLLGLRLLTILLRLLGLLLKIVFKEIGLVI
jgi:hypothetical protein